MLYYLWYCTLPWFNLLDLISLQFICNTMDVQKVRASLEKLGLPIASSGVEFAPSTLSSLDQEQMDAASVLIEALNDCPDVVRVWDNIKAAAES